MLASRLCTITDDWIQRGKYRRIAVVARVGKVLLRVVDRCLSDSCKGETKRKRETVRFFVASGRYFSFVGCRVLQRQRQPPYVCASLTHRRRATPSIVPSRMVLAWRMA